jgi:hypothetical protein
MRAVKRVSLTKPLYQMANHILGTEDAVNWTDADWHIYKDCVIFPDGFKTYDGTIWTGRDLLIHLSNIGLAHSLTHWIERMLRDIKESDKAVLKGFLYVCDSIGMPFELQYAQSREDFDILAVYIGDTDSSGEWQMRLDGEYRQFKNDSRFDLSRHCSVRAPNFTEALAKVKQAILNRGW